MNIEGFFENEIVTHDRKTVFYLKNCFSKDKKTIVFNYGLVCSHHHFKEQIEYFKNEYNIIAHDYRGHYKSTAQDNLKDVTFENICSDLNKILTSEDIKEAILIGHSMGVNVSLEFNKRFPEKTLSMILISGTPQPVYSTMFNSNIVEHLSPFLKNIFKRFPNAVKGFWGHTKHNPVIKSIIHKGGFNTKMVSNEFIQVYLSKIDELGPNLFLQLLEQMNKHDIMGYLNSISKPVLIIGGDADKVIPNFNQRIMHKAITNSELFLLKNGSHVPQLDFPNFINQRINLFLEALKEA